MLASQKEAGRAVNPIRAPTGVNGNIVPNATDPKVKTVSHLLGLLFQNGIFLVLITKIIRVSVQNDSTNQAL
jgi:hypothetical protein